MPDRRWTLGLVCLAVFMLLLDVTVVNVALPEIRQDLDASFSEIQWVVDAYALLLAAVLLPAASIGDLRGRRLVFLAGTTWFTLASLACALAPSAIALDLFRAAQGVGAAAMLATALPLIGAAFPGPERAGAIGAFAATLGAAIAVGPLVGGALVDIASWHWVFLVNLPIGLFVVLAGSRHLHESADPAGRRVDVPGFVLLTAALLTLVFAIVRGNGEGWGSAPILTALIAGTLLLGAFIAWQLRAPEPMLPLGLFRIRAFTASAVAVLAVAMGLFGMFLLLTIYLSAAFASSPLTVGLQFLPLTLVTFVASAVAGRTLAHRLPPALLLGGGLALVSIGLATFTRVDGASAWTVLIPGFVLTGLGSGVINPTAAALSLSSVEPGRAGVATGVVNLARQLGVAFGVATLGAVFEASLQSDLGERAGTAVAGGAVPRGLPPEVVGPLADALGTAALVGCAITALGAVVSAVLAASARRTTPTPARPEPARAAA